MTPRNDSGSIEVFCPLACGYDRALPARPAAGTASWTGSSGMTIFVCPDCLGVGFDGAALLEPRRQVDLTPAIRPVIESVLRDHAIDPLTSMKNRRYFFKRLASELREIESRRITSIAAFRFDSERLYRDAGSRGGDVVLRMLAATLFAELRAGDNFARVEPNAFGLILPQVDEARAAEIAGRVAAGASAKTFQTHTGKPVSVELVHAVVVLTPDVGPEESWTRLIERIEADGANA